METETKMNSYTKDRGVAAIYLVIVAVIAVFAVGGSGYYIGQKASKNGEATALESIIPYTSSSSMNMTSTTIEPVEKEDARPTTTLITPKPSISKTSNKLPQKQEQTSEIVELKLSNVGVSPSVYLAVISWTTNISADGKVVVWPTNTQTGNIIKETNNTKNHKVNIDLIPNKTYYYSIEATTNDGQIAVSEQREFRTPDDVIPPTLISRSLSMPNKISVIRLTVEVDEPVRGTVTYWYKHSGTFDDGSSTKKVVSSTIEYLKNIEIDIPKVSYTQYTELHYELELMDRSLVSSSYGEISILVRTIPETYE